MVLYAPMRGLDRSCNVPAVFSVQQLLFLLYYHWFSARLRIGAESSQFSSSCCSGRFLLGDALTVEFLWEGVAARALLPPLFAREEDDQRFGH
jgi:hypothetical protein